VTSGKTVLIISGQPEGAAAARRAKELGHVVVISDSDPQAPGFAFADSCLIADVQGAIETAAAAERYSRKIRKIDGVLCIADAALTGATVSQRLRLPGLPLHVAELAADRLATRRCFQSAGVPHPWGAEIFTPQELQRIVIARGRDLVLKPVENRGAEGVRWLAGAEDFGPAFMESRSHSPSERVLVEQYPQAALLHVNALMQDGVCHTDADVPQDARALVGRAAQAMDISDGPIAAEIASDNNAFLLCEISVRIGMPGGDLLDAAIRQALGE
jgi:biotin carboxylase